VDLFVFQNLFERTDGSKAFQHSIDLAHFSLNNFKNNINGKQLKNTTVAYFCKKSCNSFEAVDGGTGSREVTGAPSNKDIKRHPKRKMSPFLALLPIGGGRPHSARSVP